MKRYPQVVTLFTRDPSLSQRLLPILREYMELQLCQSYHEFTRLTDQRGPGVVLLDIRLPADAPDLDDILREAPHHLFIVLGNITSTPMLHPAIRSVHDTVSLREEPEEIARRVEQAQHFLDVREENRKLMAEVAKFRARENVDLPLPPRENLFSVRELIRIVRSMDNVEALQERLLEELSVAMHLSRAGIVVRPYRENSYRVSAGWMLTDASRDCIFDGADPFVRWFEKHPHLVTRAGIEHLPSPTEKLMIGRVLDRLGAEIIVPLRGRNGLIGWLFTSHPLNGLPFSAEGLDQLILVSDLMAVSLERALFHKEISLQKMLAETLINALPVGIIYVDAGGIVRWCSPATQLILGGENPDKTGQPLQSLGPKLSSLALTLNQDEPEEPLSEEWRDPLNGRPLRATAIRIESQNCYSGILITLEDKTRENAMQEKQERLDRGLFWTQLAASMSHEVRNPLVTIKTFAQLLPDRYEDPEFRAEFSTLVGQEINRLGSMIDQLNEYAHPKEVVLKRLDFRQALQFGWLEFEKKAPFTPLPEVTDDLQPALPDVLGDLEMLSQCITGIFMNAVEAVGNPQGKIHVSLRRGMDPECEETVELEISDNGPGIPEEVADQIFSPFFSRKAQGLGLGLPFAQRCMTDHHGKIEVKSNPRGTRVALILPIYSGGPQV